MKKLQTSGIISPNIEDNLGFITSIAAIILLLIILTSVLMSIKKIR